MSPAHAALALVLIGRLIVGVESAAVASPADGVETHAFVGTRVIRHVVSATATAPVDAYVGTFDVAAERTTERAGKIRLETETRFFTVSTGGYRADAAMREVVVRDEHVAGDDVVLDESQLDRASFGYLAPSSPLAVDAYAPFDRVDRETIVETYETPPVVYSTTAGTRSNATARSTQTTISNKLRGDDAESIAEHVSSDGTVDVIAEDYIQQRSFAQHADGSGHANTSSPGFSSVDMEIAAATPSADGSYAIAVTTASTGRTIGPPPYPVTKNAYTIPDWYPGGKTLPADTNVLTASGVADTRVPDACGSASRGRLAHRVIDRRTSVRITGVAEADADETYWVGSTLVCEIERRRTDEYDLATGKRSSTNDMTTTLGIVR